MNLGCPDNVYSYEGDLFYCCSDALYLSGWTVSAGRDSSMDCWLGFSGYLLDSLRSPWVAGKRVSLALAGVVGRLMLPRALTRPFVKEFR